MKEWSEDTHTFEYPVLQIMSADQGCMALCFAYSKSFFLPSLRNSNYANNYCGKYIELIKIQNTISNVILQQHLRVKDSHH